MCDGHGSGSGLAGCTHLQDEASCLRAADALGAKTLNVVAYLGHAVSLDQMAEHVGRLCGNAAERGVRIALEFLRDSGIPDLDHARRLVGACGALVCAALGNDEAATVEIEVLNEELRRQQPDEAARRLARAAFEWRLGFQRIAAAHSAP